jgi:hypothetical protein
VPRRTKIQKRRKQQIDFNNIKRLERGWRNGERKHSRNLKSGCLKAYKSQTKLVSTTYQEKADN